MGQKLRKQRHKNILWVNPHYAMIITILLLWPSNVLRQRHNFSSYAIAIFLHNIHFKTVDSQYILLQAWVLHLIIHYPQLYLAVIANLFILMKFRTHYVV